MYMSGHRSTGARVLVLRHRPTSHAGLVAEALESRGHCVDTATLDERTPTPSILGYDMLISLGSQHSVYDENIQEQWLNRELTLMEEASREGLAILGLCFGAQALCYCFGGDVVRSDVPEVGWYEITERNDSGIAAGPWFEFHIDRCRLPATATLWADNESGPQAFAIDRHVGVQFHPEVDATQLAEWLASGAKEGASALDFDREELLHATALQVANARKRTNDLVDLVMAHNGLATLA
jgi:GMP synthase-like glutamine amidotransferase